MKTAIGKLSINDSEAFLFNNPTARAGSLTSDGKRRIFTYESGDELVRLVKRVAEISGATPVPVAEQISIKTLAPGVKDLSPCVPCQAGHDVEWANLPATVDEFRAVLQKMVQERNYEFPPIHALTGDGVITVGGGRYWAGIVVSIKMLRDSGCSLPVEVWYRGDLEPVNRDDVASCGDVRFVDTYAHAVANGGARILGGFEQKIWAIANTKFERILFLDADAYCVNDPSNSIVALQDSEPFIFWEDQKPHDTSINWEKVWPNKSGTVPPVQGGQLLIDRPRCWKLLCILQWMNQHSDFYYKHGFADQDTIRIALEAIDDESLWKCNRSVRDVSGCLVLQYGGEDIIVHRISSKLFTAQWKEGNSLVWDGLKLSGVPGEDRMMQHFGAINA